MVSVQRMKTQNDRITYLEAREKELAIMTKQYRASSDVAKGTIDRLKIQVQRAGDIEAREKEVALMLDQCEPSKLKCKSLILVMNLHMKPPFMRTRHSLDSLCRWH